MFRFSIRELMLVTLVVAANVGAAEEPPKAKDGEYIVLFIKIFDTDDKGKRELISEPTLTTRLGKPTEFFVGGQVFDAGSYIDVGQRINFVPLGVSDQTIKLKIKSETTDYIKNDKGIGATKVKRQVTTKNLRLGEVNTSDFWDTKLPQLRKRHMEFRIERMTAEEYARWEADSPAVPRSPP